MELVPPYGGLEGLRGLNGRRLLKRASCARKWSLLVVRPRGASLPLQGSPLSAGGRHGSRRLGVMVC